MPRRSSLRSFHLIALIGLMALPTQSVLAQGKLNGPARLDAAEIRRQAAQLTELRALLADPDAHVRLFTMREAILKGDAVQRSTAIEVGLASDETSLLELAVGGILANTQEAIIEFVDSDGKLLPNAQPSSLRMTITSYNFNNGRIEGNLSCPGSPTFQGQLQGAVFSFKQYLCSGALSWSGATGDMRGRMNLNGGQPDGNRSAVWRPR